MWHGLERDGITTQDTQTTVPSRDEVQNVLGTISRNVIRTACRRGGSGQVDNRFGGKPWHTRKTCTVTVY